LIQSSTVFDAVRRGYNDLEHSSNDEIVNYFSDVEPDELTGHISNIKGIVFEQEYVEQLASQGVDAQIFEATNHPVVDIAIFEDGEVVNELQLKATDSVSYINATLDEHPDVAIVATSEVAIGMDSEMVIDSGIENSVLEEAVAETILSEVVNPVSPISVIGWLFGLPF